MRADLRPGRARGAGAWAARPASTSPARSGMARELGPGHTIVTILCRLRLALSEQAVQPGLPARAGPARAALAVSDAMTADPLVSTDWLAEHLGDAGPRGARRAPGTCRRDRATPEGRVRRSATSRARCSSTSTRSADHATDLPHMLPAPADFADGRAAPGRRAGFDRGGLRQPRHLLGPAGLVELPRHGPRRRSSCSTAACRSGSPRATRSRPAGARPPHGEFKARLDAELVRDLDGVRAALAAGGAQLVDARSAVRFRGEAPEPRAGLRAGHMPGALNVPWRSAGRRRRHAAGAGRAARRLRGGRRRSRPRRSSPPAAPAISAAILALALPRLGRGDVPVYDGSWTEWGASDAGDARRDRPVSDVTIRLARPDDLPHIPAI